MKLLKILLNGRLSKILKIAKMHKLAQSTGYPKSYYVFQKLIGINLICESTLYKVFVKIIIF